VGEGEKGRVGETEMEKWRDGEGNPEQYLPLKL
jgi:hypothetical protein